MQSFRFVKTLFVACIVIAAAPSFARAQYT